MVLRLLSMFTAHLLMTNWASVTCLVALLDTALAPVLFLLTCAGMWMSLRLDTFLGTALLGRYMMNLLFLLLSLASP